VLWSPRRELWQPPDLDALREHSREHDEAHLPAWLRSVAYIPKLRASADLDGGDRSASSQNSYVTTSTSRTRGHGLACHGG
jgi:hypothetical protein